jgi:tetratricopeptide (TPR) repeat protein
VLGRHPDVATALNNHGSSLEALGRLEEAEPAYRESLEMKRELIAGDHTTIASSLNNLGLLLVKRDELDAAQPLLAEALAMRLRIQDDRHPDVALAHHNLARLHERRGRLAEAAHGFERALDIRRERLEPANRLTLESAVALARVSRALGDSLRAATILEWVLQLATPTLPPDDPLLADIRRIAAAR